MVFLSGWWGHASYHEAAPLRYRPSTKDWRTPTRSTSKSVFWCIFWQFICFSVQAVVEPPRKRPRPSKAPWLRRPWVETCGSLCRNTSQRASAMQANNRPRVTRPKTPASGKIMCQLHLYNLLATCNIRCKCFMLLIHQLCIFRGHLQI